MTASTRPAITTAARRIARTANQYGGNMRGGRLAFHEDGTGGEWYRYRDSWPECDILFPLPSGHVTARQAQDFLDRGND